MINHAEEKQVANSHRGLLTVGSFSCVLRLRRVLIDEFMEQQARNHVERLKNAFTFMSGSRKRRNLGLTVVQQKLHIFKRGNIRQIAFVVLKHMRNFIQVELQGSEIVDQILKALHVFRHFFILRIGHKNDAIHPAQNKLAGGVVNDLARYGVKLEFGLKSTNRHGLDGQKVEEQGSVGTGRERNKLALIAGGGLDVIVDLHQVGCLAAHGRAVVDNFDLQLFGGLIDDCHNYFFRSNSPAKTAKCAVGNGSPARPKAAK